MKKIVIGSRESKLAVIQSNMIVDYINKNCKDIETELLTMKTTGDKILDKSLDKVGGKGLFVKELDKALIDRKSDLSVHSLKDMPMIVSEELPIIGFSKREDPRDVLILPKGIDYIDYSKPIGCSSLRREIQLKKIYPDAKIKGIRGNVITRLNKLDSGEYSALVLAAAGIKRLGLENRINRYFSVDEIMPAAGQGILAIQGRKNENYAFLSGYFDDKATIAALAERAYVRELDGGCSSPVAAHAQVEENQVTINGLYYNEINHKFSKDKITGNIEDAERLGKILAEKMRNEAQESIECKKKGKVWLVGAGPGDVGLFTLKGKYVLDNADVVVYDALVGQGILAMIPDNVRCIDVGKRSGNHTLPQWQTNEVLLKEALLGNRVVRLKGGDPFLFGRGGEELELLVKNNIPYEIVPGVTSPIAVPAYNGIPVTHRDYCSSLHIITGHKKSGEEYNIDFEALVKTKGTLVFLMGVSALKDICDGLINNGMHKDMPAAILQQGTTSGQKRIVATVSTLYEEVQKQHIETPAIIVVGKVCELAESFLWYEKLPLSGKKVVVTRPKNLISGMAQRLRNAGAEVLELPAIETIVKDDQENLFKAIEKIDDYKCIAFTSPTAVKTFFEQLMKNRIDVRSIGKIKIAAIGQATKKTLEKRGIIVDIVPEIYDGETLAKVISEQLNKNDKVLLPRANDGNEKIVEILNDAGIFVDDVAMYQTVYHNQNIIDINSEIDSNKINCVVFTSASTVKGFVESIENCKDYTNIIAACIGKQTKEAADIYGMKTYISEEATMDSLLKLVCDILK